MELASDRTKPVNHDDPVKLEQHPPIPNRMITNIANKELITWNHKETNVTLYYKEFDPHLIKWVKRKEVDHFQVSILNEFRNKKEETIAKGDMTSQYNNISTFCNLISTRRTAGTKQHHGAKPSHEAVPCHEQGPSHEPWSRATKPSQAIGKIKSTQQTMWPVQPQTASPTMDSQSTQTPAKAKIIYDHSGQASLTASTKAM